MLPDDQGEDSEAEGKILISIFHSFSLVLELRSEFQLKCFIEFFSINLFERFRRRFRG